MRFYNVEGDERVFTCHGAIISDEKESNRM